MLVRLRTLLTISWHFQTESAQCIFWYREVGKHTAGPFFVPSSGLDCLLLLCMEGGTIYRKGTTKMTERSPLVIIIAHLPWIINNQQRGFSYVC